MSANLHEWAHLLLRWFHIIAGIMWIGDSFYFMWLDSHLTRPEPARDQVEGELWMTHSGGFYRVEKRLIAPGQMPAVLHWFWSEATLTWVSGFFLLLVVYYAGGGAMLLGANPTLGSGQAMALGLGVLVGAWLVYDTLWSSPLGKNTPLSTAFSLALLCGAAYGLAHVFSGRAAFMHVGALMGTCMVCNVWFRILPAQGAMIKATEAGQQPDLSRGKVAKTRSIHNNYMTLPVIFVMLSNHFPTLYGDKNNWIILLFLFVAGGAVRYWFNNRDKTPYARAGLVTATAIVAALIAFTMPPAVSEDTLPIPTPSATPMQKASIHGTVKLEGPAPAVQILHMAGCQAHGKTEIPDNKILVNNGLIQNVFVWISGGLEGKTFPTPTTDLKMDQEGCMYTHRVVGVQAGQPVTFVNDDNTVHNVRVSGSKGDLFNTMMTSQGDTFTKKFALDPKVMLQAQCDIHPWMHAWIGVVSHPFFSVTDSSGQFAIGLFDTAQVPAGTYTLSVWHEVFGQTSQQVKVEKDGTVTADFTLKAQPQTSSR
ncbi:MAG TPA: urate hydroxylase PuuD [Candidatus Xenobia bacterium]|jgi:uncharacterized membrane protein/plastocyanin